MIKAIKSKPLLAAILLNLAWLGLSILLCDSKYEISDDFIMATILSGGYGQYTSFAPFVNICLGKVLSFLYQSIPIISWFYVYEIMLGIISFTAITYVLLKKNSFVQGCCLSILVLIFFADDIYLLPSFTKNSILAVLAGGILIVYAIWEHRKVVISRWILGALLLIGGGLLRKYCLLLGLPFLALIFLFEAVRCFKSNQLQNKKRELPAEKKELEQRRSWIITTIRNLALCAVPILIVECAGFVNQQQWGKTESRAMYTRYNVLRSSVVDIPSYGYEGVKEQYQELGLDDIDYWMIHAWNTMDLDIYPAEKLKKIASIKSERRDEKVHNESNILKKFYSRNSLGYWPVVGAFVLFIVMTFLRRNSLFYHSSLFIVSLVLVLYLYWIDRVVYRVEYGIILGLTLGMLIGDNKQDIEYQKTRRSICIITCFFLLIHSIIYLPDLNYQTLNDEEYRNYRYNSLNGSGSFGFSKYWINTNQRRAYPDLIDLIEADDEHYYLFDFNSTIQSTYYDYKPWERTPVGFYENFSYLGGITNYYPENQQQWEKQGIDPTNPLRSIVNDNILVVDSINQGTRLEYLRKYYYPNAWMEKIATVDGYPIWKYHAE